MFSGLDSGLTGKFDYGHSFAMKLAAHQSVSQATISQRLLPSFPSEQFTMFKYWADTISNIIYF